MRGLLVVGCLVLSGCQNTEDRCRSVFIERYSAEVGAGPEIRPSDEAWYREHCVNAKPR